MSDSPEMSPRPGPVALMAIVLGIGGALAASLFLFIQGQLEKLLWTTIPQALGLGDKAWWYVVLVLLVGALLVLLARRLPGQTGNSPVTGFHFDVGPATIASVLLAAIGTLAFGYVLGPEMPLIACGTAVGGLLMRGRDKQTVQLGMLLGGAAAIGAIFGNPLITGFMILEFAALGPLPAAALLPVLIALGAGYIVQVGLGPWSGLGTHTLSVQGLPELSQLTAIDIIGALIVGVVAAVVALTAREIALRVDVQGKKRPTAVLLGAWVVTSILAILEVSITGLKYDTILFSGQTAIPTILAITSASTLLVVLVTKALAYAVALGGGLRGGPIFPAAFLGVVVGTIAAVLVPGFSLAGMVIAAIAATVAAMLKLPFTAALLAVLIASSAGAEATSLAIVGSVIGFVLRTALDKRDAKREAAIGVTLA